MAELGIDVSELSKEQSEAEAGLRALGVRMEEIPDDGNKMAVIIQKIAESTKDMGKQEKLAALQAIFGTTAASGWLAVINQGPDGLKKLTDQLRNSTGAADEMAKKMMDNAQGAMTAMQSALESVAISVGTAFLPVIKDGAQTISLFAAECAKWAGNNPETVAQLGQLAAGIAGAYLALKVSMALSETYHAVLAAGTAIRAGYTAIIKAETLMTGRLTVAQRVATLAQWAWNAALTANPVGAVIMGIAALVAVMRLVYDHCTEIQIAWDNWWKSMEASYPVFTSIIKGIFNVLLTPYKVVCALVDKVKELMGFGPVSVSTGTGMRAMREDAAEPSAPHTSWLETVSHNAAGGIYNKGAFLTTFAEEGPEAAIPLDGSPRAKGLWQIAGESLGMLPVNEPNDVALRSEKAVDRVEAAPSEHRGYREKVVDRVEVAPSESRVYREKAVDRVEVAPSEPRAYREKSVERKESRLFGGEYNISIPITVNGTADSPTIRNLARQVEEAVQRALANMQHQQGRLSFA